METRSRRNVIQQSENESSGTLRVKIAMPGENHSAETSNVEKRPREDGREDIPVLRGVEEQPADTVGEGSKVYVGARCAPLRFARTVAQFNESKKDLVRSMGLGGLLHIKPHSLDMQLIKNLVDRFDPAKAALHVHGRTISATVLEVARLLGLPADGGNVEELCDSDEGHILELHLRYNLGLGIIKLTDLEKSLKLVEGEEFRARFLLYAMTAILSPTTSLNVKPKFVGLLGSLNECASLNWSKFAFDNMAEGIELFKCKRLSNDEHQYIGGCVLILKLMYLERVVVTGGQRCPIPERDSPRVKDWSANAIHRVLKGLKRTGNDFLDNEEVHVLDDTTWAEDFKGVIKDLRIMIKAGFDEVFAKMGQLVERTDSLEHKLDRLLAERGRREGGETPYNGVDVEVNVNDDDRGDKLQFIQLGVDPKTKKMKEKDIVDVPSSSHHSQKVDKSKFYETVDNLNISTEENFRLATVDAEKVRRQKRGRGELAITKDPSPPHTRSTMRPTTRRGLPQRTYTGQASAASSKVLSKRPRTLRHPGIRNTDELKKSRAIKSPYEEIRTRCPKVTKKHKEKEKKQKTKVEGVLTWSEVSAMDTIDLLDNPIEQINLYVFSSSAKRGESEIICHGYFVKLDRSDFRKSLSPGSYLHGEVIDCVADLLIKAELASSEARTKWFLPCHFSMMCESGRRYTIGNVLQRCIRDSWYVDPKMLPKRIYVPVNEVESHWYMTVVDLESWTAYILDSLPESNGERRRTKLQQILMYLDKLMSRDPLLNLRPQLVIPFSDFRVANMECAQQNNLHDCGPYVIHYMRSEWTDLFTMENTSPGPNARQELVCWMALNKYNDKDVRDTVHFESNAMWRRSKGGQFNWLKG